MKAIAVGGTVVRGTHVASAMDDETSVDPAPHDTTLARVQLKSPAWALKLPAPHAEHGLKPTCGSKPAAHTHVCAPVARVVAPAPHGVHDALLLALLNVPTAHGTKSPEAPTVAPGLATQPREDDEATERPPQFEALFK